MRRTFMDEQFDEWEAYVSGGQPGGSTPARVMFVCLSTPTRRPRFVNHSSGDPVAAESELYRLEEEGLAALFADSQPMP